MEPIAIVGMACRLPGAESLEEFWSLLIEGRHGIRLVPGDRWDCKEIFDPDPKKPGKVNSSYGGFMAGIDSFDYGFFGISPREAAQMDPQQRILLELAHESFEDSGIAVQELIGTDTGVFVGVMNSDHTQKQTTADFGNIDIYTGSGIGYGMLAARISYQFDLCGPSMAIDSACSSSLVSVFLGCQSLWSHQCSLVLAAGTNLMLSAAFNVWYTKAGLSAPDGKCKTFSANADGIGRGEGACVVVLKRLSDAERARDRIYAIILGGAVIHGGRGNGLTAPNRRTQEQLLHSAYRHAGVSPDSVDYVELHGTGTPTGDPIEAMALGTVLKEGRDPARPCLVGSVKTNLGHLEGAAGIAGLVKVALSLHHSRIAPSLWFDQPNPLIPFDSLSLQVQSSLIDWPLRDRKRRAGISSFGLGGTIAHLVLEASPQQPPALDLESAEEQRCYLLPLSACSENALRQMAGDYARHIKSQPLKHLAPICHATATHRSLHEYRATFVASSQEQMIANLSMFHSGSTTSHIYEGRHRQRPRTKLLFAYPEYSGIDCHLFLNLAESYSRFKDSLSACDALLRSILLVPIHPLLQYLQQRHIHQSDAGFFYLHFAIQSALTDLWLSAGLQPDAVLGVGLGEAAAWRTAGAISMRSALIRIANARCDALCKGVSDDVAATVESHMDCYTVAGKNVMSCSLGNIPRTHASVAAFCRDIQKQLQADVVLQDARIESWSDSDVDIPPWLIALRSTEESSFENCLAHLSVRHNIWWNKFLRHPQPSVRCPSYPWQRKRCWPDDAPTIAGRATDHSSDNNTARSPVGARTFASVTRGSATSASPSPGEIFAGPTGKHRVDPLRSFEAQRAASGLDRRTLLKLKKQQRQWALVEYLKMHLSNSLQMPLEEVDESVALNSIGIDSLMALEIKNVTSRDLQVVIPLVRFLDGSSIENLAVEILAQLAPIVAPEEKASSTLQLSPNQEMIWRLDQFQRGNPTYNFQLALDLDGLLQRDVLQIAVQRLAERHEPLRMSFNHKKGQPLLHVLPEVNIPIAFFDISLLPANTWGESIHDLARKDIQSHFDLSKTPLFRLTLVRQSSDLHVLILTMHHIVSDLLSLQILFMELGEFYSATVQNRSEILPAITKNYNDFAHLQKAQGDNPRNFAYWSSTLAGAPEIEWFGDYPRPSRPSGASATEFFNLSLELIKKVDSFARQAHVTSFVVLLTVFDILLHALSGQEDLVLGSPTTGRTCQEFEHLIGMFSYPLVLRTNLGGNPDFNELLSRHQKTLLGAQEHADLSFARILDAAHESQPQRISLLRAMFSYAGRLKSAHFEGIKCSFLPTERKSSDLDIFITLYQTESHCQGTFEYSTELFRAETIRELIKSYKYILEAAIQSPSTLLSVFTATIPVTRPLQIGLASSFAATLLEKIFPFWSKQASLPLQVKFAPYNQIIQHLLDPESPFFSADQSLNFFLIRPEDWARFEKDATAKKRAVEHCTQTFIAALRQASDRMYCNSKVYICPASPQADPQLALVISQAEKRICEDLTGIAGIEILQAEKCIPIHYEGNIHDALADQIGHVPYTQSFFVMIGMTLTRKISLFFRKPYKVLVLDCDYTLWKGTCSEDGATGVGIEEPYLVLQEFVRQQLAGGMLVCICSKNDLSDVKAVFREHRGMVLREEDIASWRANWEPKSSNLHSLAAELQLPLESFIFIDDSPVECAEVSSHCPEVLTLCLPRDISEIPQFLQHVWAFDREAISVEDTKRTQLYRENHLREGAAAQAISYHDFLCSLNLQISMQQAKPEQLQRIIQLSQRTNQFNSLGTSYSESELQRAISQGLKTLSVEVRDCFGDYGLVGVIMCRKNAVSLSVEAFYLSCRVLGRGVEHGIISQLGSLAQAAGLNSIRLVYRESVSNQPFGRFVNSLGGLTERSMGHEISIFLKTEDALRVTFSPPEATVHKQERPTTPVGLVPARNNHDKRSMIGALSKLPHTLVNIKELQAFADYFASANRKVATNADFAAPQNELEQQIALTWASVLGIVRVSRDENFFEAGGNSLRFMQLAARLSEKFGRNIEITELFQFPTISSLATYLRRNASERPAAESYQRGLRTKASLQQLKMRMASGRR